LKFKRLLKDFDVEQKNLLKRSRQKRRNVNADGEPRTRVPSGIDKPSVVSDELYKFLELYGIEPGTEIARTKVVSYISNYVKKNNLKNPEVKKEIVPDEVLQALLTPPVTRLDKNDPESRLIYTYTGIQPCISHHFPKSNKTKATE
jgi:chromatin remodeling complex protein RSC6